MTLVVLILIIGLSVVIVKVQSNMHKGTINQKIAAMGGYVINIKPKRFDEGPAFFVGKGAHAYKIEYIIDDQQMVGWVKFGGVGGTKWKL